MHIFISCNIRLELGIYTGNFLFHQFIHNASMVLNLNL